MTTSGIFEAFELPGEFGLKLRIDLNAPLTAQRRAELQRLFSEHLLLYMEAGDITLQKQLEVGSIFGKMIPTSVIDEQTHSYVSNSRADGHLGNAELAWHTDACFLVEPPRAAILHALDVPPGASATRFVSAAGAVGRLPAGLRQDLRYLQIINSSEINTKVGNRVSEFGSDIVGAAHPIIAKHPVSGVKYLTANPYHTDCVIGMTSEESRDLLNEVYKYLYDENAVYEHVWKNGDLVIWDNLAIQHSRRDISHLGNRTLRRVTAGTATFADQIPQRQFKNYLAVSKQRRTAAIASTKNTVCDESGA